MSQRERETREPETRSETPDPERREALRAIARFGAYVTPAMTVLISPAEAHHQPGHGLPPGQCNQLNPPKGCSTL